MKTEMHHELLIRMIWFWMYAKKAIMYLIHVQQCNFNSCYANNIMIDMYEMLEVRTSGNNWILAGIHSHTECAYFHMHLEFRMRTWDPFYLRTDEDLTRRFYKCRTSDLSVLMPWLLLQDHYTEQKRSLLLQYYVLTCIIIKRWISCFGTSSLIFFVSELHAWRSPGDHTTSSLWYNDAGFQR